MRKGNEKEDLQAAMDEYAVGVIVKDARTRTSALKEALKGCRVITPMECWKYKSDHEREYDVVLQEERQAAEIAAKHFCATNGAPSDNQVLELHTALMRLLIVEEMPEKLRAFDAIRDEKFSGCSEQDPDFLAYKAAQVVLQAMSADGLNMSNARLQEGTSLIMDREELQRRLEELSAKRGGFF